MLSSCDSLSIIPQTLTKAVLSNSISILSLVFELFSRNKPLFYVAEIDVEKEHLLLGWSSNHFFLVACLDLFEKKNIISYLCIWLKVVSTIYSIVSTLDASGSSWPIQKSHSKTGSGHHFSLKWQYDTINSESFSTIAEAGRRQYPHIGIHPKRRWSPDFLLTRMLLKESNGQLHRQLGDSSGFWHPHRQRRMIRGYFPLQQYSSTGHLAATTSPNWRGVLPLTPCSGLEWNSFISFSLIEIANRFELQDHF